MVGYLALSLDRPELLWWLLLLPVIYWLSRPIRPRGRVATPHLAQWLRARARIGRRRVRFPWLRFILVVLAVSLATLAACRPRVGGRQGPRALAVLLDTSASMAAERGDVWRAVRERLATVLRGLPEHVEARLVLCGAAPRVVVGDAAALLAAVPQEPAGGMQVDLGALADRLVGDAAGELAVWTLSDGLGPMRLPLRGALDVFGRPADNVALTAVDVVDFWPLPEVRVTVVVRGFTGEPSELELAAEGGVEPAAESVRVDAGGAAEVELVLKRTEGGRVEVRLVDHRDALALDDVVVVDVPPPAAPAIAVQCDGEPPPGLEAAARALAEESGGRLVAPDRMEGLGFLLVDGGIIPSRAPGFRALTFGTRSQSRELTLEDLVVEPRVVDWDRRDPLTVGLDLSELEVRSCLREDFLATGPALVRAEHGALVAVDERADGASVHASFRLGDSNFALLPAFPQFVRRSFARAFRDRGGVRVDPAALLDPAESDLSGAAGAAEAREGAQRALPEFGSPGTDLTVLALVLAAAALAARVYA